MDKGSIACILSVAYMQHRMSTETPLSPEEFYENYHEEYEDALKKFFQLVNES